MSSLKNPLSYRISNESLLIAIPMWWELPTARLIDKVCTSALFYGSQSKKTE